MFCVITLKLYRVGLVGLIEGFFFGGVLGCMIGCLLVVPCVVWLHRYIVCDRFWFGIVCFGVWVSFVSCYFLVWFR